MTAEEVSIRGVTTDAESWGDARSRLGATLLSGTQLETRVIEVPPIQDYQALCRQHFDAALHNRTLEFAIAKSTLESGAEALLDGLLEIVADCPDATILVRANADGDARDVRTVSFAMNFVPAKRESTAAGTLSP